MLAQFPFRGLRMDAAGYVEPPFWPWLVNQTGLAAWLETVPSPVDIYEQGGLLAGRSLCRIAAAAAASAAGAAAAAAAVADAAAARKCSGHVRMRPRAAARRMGSIRPTLVQPAALCRTRTSPTSSIPPPCLASPETSTTQPPTAACRWGGPRRAERALAAGQEALRGGAGPLVAGSLGGWCRRAAHPPRPCCLPPTSPQQMASIRACLAGISCLFF